MRRHELGPPWQNHSRLLTGDEIDEIRSCISGIHFSQEVVLHDNETARLLFYCAEALQRDIDRLHSEGFRMPYREGVDYDALETHLARLER